MCTALQQKIVELESKLRQPHQSESEVAVLKQMIEEMELKLKATPIKIKTFIHFI
uniref:Uncharacterized protein n=1 Tax=Setaria italica TaxID=4555 RepID=K3YMX6_SETIT